MADVLQGYRFAQPSALTGRDLRLQTSAALDGPAVYPRFFTGFLTTPQPAALGLLAVAEVARTRYFQPREPGSRDPVVTGNRDRLRFESFSGCCGVYARLDVLPAGLDGPFLDHGTTNVDVNAPLRQALARVGGLEPLHLDVGPEDLTVSTMDGAVVERKVPLPARWLRGFAEVQVIASGFDARAELPAAAANQFLRTLPTTRDRAVLWAVPAGRSLRLTASPVPGAVCLPGPARLAALRPLLRFATSLRVYGPAVTSASGPVASTWELSTGALRLSLTLSPELNRGFSGEGAVLHSLAGDDAADDADLVSALLAWDPAIDVDTLAGQADLDPARVRAALARLGTAGQVGYDVAEAAHFHRVLPYDASRAVRDNPRLVAARALVAAGAVTADPAGASTVDSGGQVYRVRRVEGRHTCTCLWWSKYRGGRGPCKHALAVELALDPAAARP